MKIFNQKEGGDLMTFKQQEQGEDSNPDHKRPDFSK